MNKSNSASKIKMKSFDDLFGTNENLEQANANGGEIREIPLASLHTFRNHPFQIHEDKLEEMVESVRQYGVLVPGIARMRPQGGYEIIAGHTRKAACELAGLDTMPMFIRNLNDDEATIVMVDSNIQREDIFPSEKARAYSMRYYAMKHQGIKGDKGSSLDIMSEETTLRRNVAYMEPPGFSITSVYCRNCGASFDSVRQRNCPYCGTVYHMENEGFIIERLELV